MEGDFTENSAGVLKPQCIFYNPFPFAADEFRATTIFLKIYLIFASIEAQNFLFLSNSVMIRGALLAAGFYTGTGTGSGIKITAAFTSKRDCTSEIELLDLDWLLQFRQSILESADVFTQEKKSEIERLVLAHPQFLI